MAVPVLNPPKSILWVDDEGELLEPHRIFLRSKGYTVEWASNADDAIELLKRRPFDILLLDEQMPGKRGLEVYRDVREIAPSLPVVMVTKSEEDSTLKEAIGVNVRDYLVKPINPRQVLTVVTRILEGPRIRQQAIARSFVERFRAIELERDHNLDWRGWIDRYDELMRWDVDLAAAGEMGLYESLQGLYPDMHREFAGYMKTHYPEWLKNLEGNRPPLSIDIVSEFLLPILERDKAAVFIVVDCLRLDQWRVLEPLLAPFFDTETTHYFAVLPTATPYSRNSLFSGLFPGEIAARLPDWWGNADREDESLNAHEKELLESHLEELVGKTPDRRASSRLVGECRPRGRVAQRAREGASGIASGRAGRQDASAVSEDFDGRKFRRAGAASRYGHWPRRRQCLRVQLRRLADTRTERVANTL